MIYYGTKIYDIIMKQIFIRISYYEIKFRISYYMKRSFYDIMKQIIMIFYET